MDSKPLYAFPRWSNTATLVVLLVLATVPLYAFVFIGYAGDPVTLNVGYQPVQPVAYSHALHVGQLGLDCRYCHNTVEQADFAALPPTETCMNCHRGIWPKDAPGHDKLGPIRASYATGLPVGKEGTLPGWRKVTTVPDYVYFSHAAHVNAGVGCVECHGQVNQMEEVYQAKPMNMGWCLECHRDPAARLRPRDAVTKLDWAPGPADASTVEVFANLGVEELKRRGKEAGIEFSKLTPGGINMGPVDITPEIAKQSYAGWYLRERTKQDSATSVRNELGTILKDQYHVNPSTDCITCHR
jgi:menaquinone reductase, multiheme cytochrome c subunit